MGSAGVIIFAITYVLVSARRLGVAGVGRPAVALAGAVACVVFGVLSPAAAVAAIDGHTLLLLCGVMGMGAFLSADGVVERVEMHPALRTATPQRLLAIVLWGSGLLSPFLTNDAVCLLGAPLVLRMVRRGNLPAVPYLLALATGANTGSVATLVGNPQNMLCAQFGDLEYLRYALLAAPLAVVLLGINHVVIAVAFSKTLPAGAATPVELPNSEAAAKSWAAPCVIAATAVAFTAGAPLAWTAVAGFGVLLLLRSSQFREVFRLIDWGLLGFFAGLFVVVGGLTASGATAVAFDYVGIRSLEDSPWALAAVFAIGSNAVSNVPFILIVAEEVAAMADPRAGWTMLAVTSTLAGNLTLLGSAANIIVLEAADESERFGFWEHLRVGLPITVLTTAVAVLWLLVFDT